MINRIYELPKTDKPSAEWLKIENLFRAYPDISQLFLQKETDAVIFSLGKNIIISGKPNFEELKNFLMFLKPDSVFSSADNLSKLYGSYNEVNVLICQKCSKTSANTFNYDFSSKQAYELLNIDEFDLPPYEHFAADYCRRKNHGLIKVFGKADSCIAITLESENYRMLSGIASKQKGSGGALLLAAISGNTPVLTVCRDELVPFYTKYGFTYLYKAGYWRKQT